LWDSFSGDSPNSVVHELTFFVHESELSKKFVRKDEIHMEKTYSLETYLKMLENVGFVNVQVYADFTQNYPKEDSRRWFFVCRKI
jgi:hypothetical protein